VIAGLDESGTVVHDQLPVESEMGPDGTIGDLVPDVGQLQNFFIGLALW